MPRRGENIRKRKDNRWEGRYIKGYDENGKAKYGSVYGKTYLEAKKRLVAVTAQLAANKPVVKEQNVTYERMLNAWLENNRIKLKSQTYSKYKQLIDCHILPMVGKTPLKKVNAAYINQILLAKSNNGRMDGEGGLAPSYVRSIAFIMKSAISFAAGNDYCTPLKGEIFLPAKTKQKLDVLTASEQEKLGKSCIRSVSDKDLGILLSLYMGLRIGEVCGLRWENVDFENNIIHVEHTVERIKNIDDGQCESKTCLVLAKAKTIMSNRIIPIPNNILPLLLQKRRQEGFVIKGQTYEYIDPRSMQFYFKKKLEQCQVRYVNYHVLRHTFATRCMEAGMDIKSLSEILGHSGANITLNIYVHSSLEHKRKQMEIMASNCGQK